MLQLKPCSIFLLFLLVFNAAELRSQTRFNPVLPPVEFTAYQNNETSAPLMSKSNHYQSQPAAWVAAQQLVIGPIEGSVIGILSGLGTMCLFADFENSDKHKMSIGTGYAIGASIGYVLGNGYAIHKAGENRGIQGSRTATIVGSILGTLAGAYIYDRTKMGWGVLAGAPVLATLSFHISSKRY